MGYDVELVYGLVDRRISRLVESWNVKEVFWMFWYGK